MGKPHLQNLVGLWIMLLGCAGLIINLHGQDIADIKLKAELRIVAAEMAEEAILTRQAIKASPELDGALQRSKRLQGKLKKIRNEARRKDRYFDRSILSLVLAVTIAGPVLILAAGGVTWALLGGSFGMAVTGLYQAGLGVL